MLKFDEHVVIVLHWRTPALLLGGSKRSLAHRSVLGGALDLFAVQRTFVHNLAGVGSLEGPLHLISLHRAGNFRFAQCTAICAGESVTFLSENERGGAVARLPHHVRRTGSGKGP